MKSQLLSLNHRRRRAQVRFTSLHADQETPSGQAAGLIAVLADEAANSPLKQAQLQETHQRVLAAMEKLDNQQRAVLVLRDIEQFPYDQIAGILQIPVGTVKSRLARARMAIRCEVLDETMPQTKP